MRTVRTLHVVTHRDPLVAGPAIQQLVDCAEHRGVTLSCGAREIEKHPLLGAHALVVDDDQSCTHAQGCDAVIVLSGDGTLLEVAGEVGAEVPVLGVNFGMLGYLSGAAHDAIDDAVEQLAAGTFETVDLPRLQLTFDDGRTAEALNDIVMSAGVTGRINELLWRVLSTRNGAEHSDEMGAVPCDGMVVSTPVGSTAYNLSNGGPVMAWGVQGSVVSFIAPHTLAARPLVVAPDDVVEIELAGRGGPLKVFADGRSLGGLEHRGSVKIKLQPHGAQLAFIDDTSFYARYRKNFAIPMQFTGPRVRRSQQAGSS